MGSNIVRLLAIGVCLFLLAPLAHAEKRVALVIGNGAYRNAPTLANPTNDAEDVAASLKNADFEVLLERNLDKRGMESAIARFARLAQGADTALFFYAGHGMQHAGSNYLMPVDAKLEDEFSLNFELSRLDDVMFALGRARGVKVLVLDACRNNPLLDQLARRAITRDLIATRGLAKVEATDGMVISYSTQPNQLAVDGTGRNSPFSAALVKQINDPGVEVATLFRRVAIEVDKATDGRQLPELSLSLRGEYYLNNHDLLAWNTLKDTSDPAALKDFINRYPSSARVLDATRRLSTLEREQAERARSEREQTERGKLEGDQAERARFEREQAERARLNSELTERLRLEREQIERAKLELEQAERAQREREQADRDKADAKTNVASLTQPAGTPLPSVSQPPSTSSGGANLARQIKAELKRVGCYS